MAFEQFVIDASLGAPDGIFCFCPVELDKDGNIESVITGMNFIGSMPENGTFIGVVHSDGQQAVEEFCEKFAVEIAKLKPLSSE